jgi:hypothetical protein
MAKGVSPYGDGHAAERIAAVVARHVRVADQREGASQSPVAATLERLDRYSARRRGAEAQVLIVR